MAIEKMKKAFIVARKSKDYQTLKQIENLGIIQFEKIENLKLEDKDFFLPSVDTEIFDLDSIISKINQTVSFFHKFFPPERSFFDSFISPKKIVSRTDLKYLTTTYNYKKILQKASELETKERYLKSELEKNTSLYDDLSSWVEFPYDLHILAGTKKTMFKLGEVPVQSYLKLLKSSNFYSFIFVSLLKEEKKTKKIFVVYPISKEKEVKELLSTLHFAEKTFPLFKGAIKENLTKISKKIKDAKEELSNIYNEVSDFAKEIDNLIAIREFFANERRKILIKKELIFSSHAFLIKGFVKEKDITLLNEFYAKNSDNLIVLITDVSSDENVPVSLKNHPLIQPLEVLVKMFGYPVYGAFDATIFLSIPFLIFFGLCLGDVLYGIFTIILSLLLMKRLKFSQSAKNFFMLFIYGGISSVIFGALTGSWGGDLISAKYLGENNILVHVAESLKVIDPMISTFTFLVFVWVLGFINQLYGVVLSMSLAIKRKDASKAIFDGIGWIIFLPSISFLLIASKFPPIIQKVNLIFLAIGGILLLIGGGRNIQSKPFKIFGGIINLYGILSSYGIGSFLGDVLSYSRLLALGLTTSILASSFNLIAGLLNIPVLKFLLIPLVLLFGHFLNFFMGIMGAFIHSARLILLEFFGRFYESGGGTFKPFAFKSDFIEIKD